MSAIETGGLHLMRHALGADPRSAEPVSKGRNHYCARVGSYADLKLLALAAAGLVKVGKTINNGECRYYHVTDSGIAAVRKHIAAERERVGLRVWAVRYDDGEVAFERTVVARSRSAARWEVVRDCEEVGMPVAAALRSIRSVTVRGAA